MSQTNAAHGEAISDDLYELYNEVLVGFAHGDPDAPPTPLATTLGTSYAAPTMQSSSAEPSKASARPLPMPLPASPTPMSSSTMPRPLPRVPPGAPPVVADTHSYPPDVKIRPSDSPSTPSGSEDYHVSPRTSSLAGRQLPQHPSDVNGSRAYKRPSTGDSQRQTLPSSPLNGRQSHAPGLTHSHTVSDVNRTRSGTLTKDNYSPSNSTGPYSAEDQWGAPQLRENGYINGAASNIVQPPPRGASMYGYLDGYNNQFPARNEYPGIDPRLVRGFPPQNQDPYARLPPGAARSHAPGMGSLSPQAYTMDEDGEDGASALGALLMRSPSIASSMHSATGSAVASPTDAQPTQPLPNSGALQGRVSSLSSTDSQYPPQPARMSYRQISLASGMSVSDANLPTPSIITTPAQDMIMPQPSSSRPHHEYQRINSMKGRLEIHEQDDEDDEYDEEDDDESRFVNLALLSHIAVKLRDKVPRGTHVKGSVPYQHAFTGKDIVSTIQALIQKELLGIPNSDRRAALQVARSLQSQLFFYEVEWSDRVLSDGVEDVFMFLDDFEGTADDQVLREELPTGLITLLTKCYAPSCTDEEPCYAYACPRRTSALSRHISQKSVATLDSPKEQKKGWEDGVTESVLKSIPQKEINRQSIIFKVIKKEEQYIQDLDTVESLYINGLRNANPPVIPPADLEEFIEEAFGNILDLRECNRRFLEVMYVRQREEGPVIKRIGDVFLAAAAEFRTFYPIYVGHLPVAEKRIKDESESNAEFKRFLETVSRQTDTRRMELKHFITRPSEHLQKYPVLLEAIFHETEEGNPDADYLLEAEQAIRNLSTVAQLRTFQSAMGRGPTGKLEWHDLLPKDMRGGISKSEGKRQSVIFELIKGEMVYVKDLETIETLFIRPLKNANPPIIPRERLNAFVQDVFHNFAELHGHHRRLLDRLHEIQREEHPMIRSITEAVFDAALNWRDAYMEYIPHYPISAFRIDDEMANNLSFKAFVEQCIRHPDARKLDMKAFVNRPIPRLLRYDLLLKAVMEGSPPGHADKDSIPQVLDVIKDLGKATEPGVTTAKQKVELWRYHANLVWKAGETVDMDLLDETRTLVHTGKLLRQPETGFEWSGWTELFVLLFDNYMVMTKPKEKDGVMKYHVNRRPIPLELLSLANFTDPPQQRSQGLLRNLRGGERQTEQPQIAADAADSRMVYPCTIHHNGRLGGLYTFFAESAQVRTEWKERLEEAMGLRAVVQESNKVFEIDTLSLDTFLVPSMHHNPATAVWNEETMFTGKVTCSVPFSTADGRGLVAVGCAEGVWIGLRHDSRSMKRVLHLKLVTQCAMLEDFGIFLVLADKSLFAYHIEALVPSNPPTAGATRTPQKLNGSKDVQFFSVGTLGGRTLIIYMKKKGLDSVFRVLEPVVGKIAEKARHPGAFGGRFNFGGNRSEWFRVYRDFFLPSESFDLIFLKAKIAILCTKGFEIMDLVDFKSVTIPQRDDPRLVNLAKRCEACKPLGMFRASENEFLLVYNEFGLYVDRHGDPSRTMVTIEWEGTAERAACHPPYILLFDSRFIEIRHIDTGRLAQIIPGTEIRCLWDGRGSNVPPVTTPGPDGWKDGSPSESRVHAVMKVPEGPSQTGQARPKAVAQHVFELVPTIPLYLPGSLASPSASTYFPQHPSPPHSPRLTAWR